MIQWRGVAKQHSSIFYFYFTLTIQVAIRWGGDYLKGTPSPRLDAELLLCYVLNQSQAFLLTHGDDSISFFQKLRYHHLLWSRKSGGWPIAYLLGKKEFYGLEFEVNCNVLIPRVDTEVLVEEVIHYFKNKDLNSRPDESGECLLLDVGTGCGCIPISILNNIPHLKGLAVDISSRTLRVAKKNAKKHGVGDRLEFRRMDLLSDFEPNEFEGRDVILTANLPYVPLEWERDSSTLLEPDLALFAKEEGLILYKKLVQQLDRVNPRMIFLEMFYFQLKQLEKEIKRYRLVQVKKMTGQAVLGQFDRL